MIHLLLAMCCVAPQATAHDHAADERELRAIDQKLLDADATGDKASYEKAFAANAVFVDENGTIMDRAAFLEQLQPLPAGSSGTIAMTEYKVQWHGDDLATIVHRDSEDETYFGNRVHAEYLTSETWQRQNGEWKLLQAQVLAVPITPKPIVLPAFSLQAFVGTYTAGSLTYKVSLVDGHLEGGVVGRKVSKLEAESAETFFVAGAPRVRKIFQRDAAGKVSGMVDRREGRDLVWTKS